MKTKTMNKKLNFNKLTISHLSDIQGGKELRVIVSHDSQCKSCFLYSCAYNTLCPEVGCI